uniref:Uncharacterized protein n=1 Tax=Pipistrellus kuhlii TaxID=59472 RepID=A0A7J7ZKF9_PIPKU|nr:hypothetical protein mPipKuh1_009645 [Pipistrellus kuhlii]
MRIKWICFLSKVLRTCQFHSKLSRKGTSAFLFCSLCLHFFLKKYILLIFIQRGRERDRELETLMRESHQSAAPCTPPTGDMPATKVHALARNRTRDPSVPKPTLYQLSQTGPGYVYISVLWSSSVGWASPHYSSASLAVCPSIEF